MKRVAIFIDGSENDLDSLRSAMLFSGITDARLDVHHPWARKSVIAPAPNVKQPHTSDTIINSGRRRAREAFHEACGDSDRTRFLEINGWLEDAVRTFGVNYDMVILERLSEEEGPHAKAFNAAIFDTGAPVLIAPPNAPEAIGRHVAMVWTGTSQSARALRAALPVMQSADKVSVLINSANELARPHLVKDYLAVHGIEPQMVEFDGSHMTARGRGRAIIAAVEDIGADLLVMGAFGASAMEGVIGLGRTTRKLVTAAPVPLLLHS